MRIITLAIALTLAAFCLANPSFAQEKKPCSGTTVKGDHCGNYAKKGSDFCWVHDPHALRCKGTTKKGLSCKSLATKGSPYCWRHKPTKS